MLRTALVLDNDWRFFRGDLDNAHKTEFDDSSWRHVDVPHDYSIEDLEQKPQSDKPALHVGASVWRFSLGDDPAWSAVDFNDEAWQSVTTPALWSTHVEGQHPNSFGWYRRTIKVESQFIGKDITMVVGKIDDVDETFVNGVRVGGCGSFPPDYQGAHTVIRRYQLPAGLLKGDGSDCIAIRSYNGPGDAGLYETGNEWKANGPFDPAAIGGGSQGHTVGGPAWYRRRLTLDPKLNGKKVILTFDGVYMNASVWLNDVLLGKHPYGYTTFSFDITPHVKFGQENILSVRCDSSGQTSRWYSGSGIYRHVHLEAFDRIHIAQYGLFATTAEANEEKARIHVSTNVLNESDAPCELTLTTALIDGDGEQVAIAQHTQSIKGSGEGKFECDLIVQQPKLWSPETPALYRLHSSVRIGNKTLDETDTNIGIRTISVDVKNGFLLNGKSIKLRGGCAHHDHGALGSCAYDRAEERRIELLKASGYNSVRTSHNPPTPAFLDACDRIGLLVIDESFDCWRIGKNPHDYGVSFDEWWKADVDSMVLRDRNHPSVAFWSIGNEIPEQCAPEAGPTLAMQAARVRELDNTRPVTQAFVFSEHTPEIMERWKPLDVLGYNYMREMYAPDQESYPGIIIMGTETFPLACFDSWMETLAHPYVIGDYVWTAIDYIGEAALGKTIPVKPKPGYHDTQPWTLANCGDIDLIGEKRPQSYYRDAVWGVTQNVSCFVQPVLSEDEATKPNPLGNHVGAIQEGWGWYDEEASWTWPEFESKPMKVKIYSSCPKVQLLLNGADLGVRENNRSTRYTAEYEIPYTPGELIAVGLSENGQELTRWRLSTAETPNSLSLKSDRNTIKTDGDIAFVTVRLLDKKGDLCTTAANTVTFEIQGPGKIIAVGNADPRSLESFQKNHRKAYRGLCQVIVKSQEGAGKIVVSAKAEGLETGTVVVEVR